MGFQSLKLSVWVLGLNLSFSTLAEPAKPENECEKAAVKVETSVLRKLRLRNSDFLVSYRDAIAPVVARHRAAVFWPSRFLNGTKIVSEDAVERLVRRVFHDLELQSEIRKLVDQLGGPEGTSPELWNLYFRSYDSIVGYSDGYMHSIRLAEQALPRSGLFVDYGAGTGNFSTAFMAASPKRRAFLIDVSSHGLSVAREKLSLVSPKSRFQTLESSVTTPNSALIGKVRGGVMNNVLYSLSPEMKVAALKRIFHDLKSGGSVSLIDPKPMTQTAEDLEAFLVEIGRSAARNGSPMTDYDVVLVTAINLFRLTARTPPFMSAEQLEQLARSVGFRVLERSDTYYGRTTYLKLQKP